MGVGGSHYAGLSKRKAIGIDLNENFIEAYKKCLKKLALIFFPQNVVIVWKF